MQGVANIYLPWLNPSAEIKVQIMEDTSVLSNAMSELASYGEGYGSKENARVNKVFADKTMKDVVPRLELVLAKAEMYLNAQDEIFPQELRARFSKEDEAKIFVKLLKRYVFFTRYYPLCIVIC